MVVPLLLFNLHSTYWKAVSGSFERLTIVSLNIHSLNLCRSVFFVLFEQCKGQIQRVSRVSIETPFLPKKLKVGSSMPESVAATPSSLIKFCTSPIPSFHGAIGQVG